MNSVKIQAGLHPYFHVRPHSPDGDLKKGCTVKYSLKRHDLLHGDKIANDWAYKYGLEEIGSGCRMIGDPIRDIRFEPVRMLPLELDSKHILPHLYTIEITDNFVSVTFDTFRIPNRDFESVSQFLRSWAEKNNLSFCSSRTSTRFTNRDDRSCVSFRPKGDIGGSVRLLVTPGMKDTNRSEDQSPEDAPVAAYATSVSAAPSTQSNDSPSPTEDFVTDDSPFS